MLLKFEVMTKIKQNIKSKNQHIKFYVKHLF